MTERQQPKREHDKRSSHTGSLETRTVNTTELRCHDRYGSSNLGRLQCGQARLLERGAGGSVTSSRAWAESAPVSAWPPKAIFDSHLFAVRGLAWS
jgi:hypothetical protein